MTVMSAEGRVLEENTYAAEEVANENNKNPSRQVWSVVNAFECVFLALPIIEFDCVSSLQGFSGRRVFVDIFAGKLSTWGDAT